MSIDSAGNEDLRNYVQNNWDYLALIDSNNNQETRFSISGDSRVSWSSGSGTNPLTITGTITGSDSDITLSVTITEYRLYQTSSATTAMDSKSIPDALIQVDADTLDIEYDVEIPDI